MRLLTNISKTLHNNKSKYFTSFLPEGVHVTDGLKNGFGCGKLEWKMRRETKSCWRIEIWKLNNCNSPKPSHIVSIGIRFQQICSLIYTYEPCLTNQKKFWLIRMQILWKIECPFATQYNVDCREILIWYQ